MDRILGKIEGTQPGPLIICIAAIHGNEQMGIHAFRNVYSAIVNHQIPVKGKLIGILGNIGAIKKNTRYIDYDLNRCWKPSFLEDVLNRPDQQAEDEELKALFEIMEQEAVGEFPLKVIADLHATSSDKGNFIVVPEDESDHPVIQALHLPVVVGLDKYLEGTLLSYYHQKGFVSFAFEGGTIGDPESYRLHTSGLWEILDQAGMITHHDHEEEDHYANELAKIAKEFPKKVEIIYRHRVKPHDGFQMLPGFHNFQPVHKDQMLAIDDKGEITSPSDGHIFMPLYQSVGDDGFFIVKAID